MLAKLRLLLFSAATALAFAAAQAPATAAEIDRDASLTMAWAGPMSSLDPHVVPGLADQIHTFLMYDRLVNLDSSVQLQPMLAKSWKVSDDGRSLTLQLRDDVLFHDGTKFNAAAVKANLERAKTLETSTVKNSLASIETVEVVGDYEVKLNLAAGKGGDLLPLLASTAGAMISPKAIADGRDLRLAPGDAGSGAYMPTTARPSDTVIFVRSPVKYWDTKAGNLKQFEVRFVTQAAARLNGIRAGQFDLAQNPSGGDMAAAKKLAEGGTIAAHEAQTSNVQGMILRGDRPNLTNVKLRQAITHAIDRQAISDAVFGGNCKPTTQGLVDTHWAYNKSLDGFSNYDPAKAAELVKESGIANPSFDLVFSPGTSWEPQANIIQGMLTKVGINAKLTPMPQQDGLTAVRNGQVDAFVYVLVATVDPSTMVSSLFTTGYNMASGDMKAKIEEMAAKATDPKQTPEQRAAIYGEIFKIGAENALYFPICASKVVWAHKKNITGIADAWWYFSSLPDFRNIAVTK